MLSLPVGDGAVGSGEMRSLPELEALLLDEGFVHLDAKARRVADLVDSTVEPRLHGKDRGVVEAMVAFARRRTPLEPGEVGDRRGKMDGCCRGDRPERV